MASSRIGRRTGEDIVIDTWVYLMMAGVFFATVYPFYYCLVISFNMGTDAVRGGIFLFPRAFTVENYLRVFSSPDILSGFGVSALRTAVGTVVSVLFTGLFAFSLAHKQLKFRRVYMTMLLISMYFSGGIVPYFLLIRSLGLYNSFLVYIIPGLLGAFNVIIMISFFQSIPDSLEEAARIDGANDLSIFFRIIVPVSMPIIATVALFNGVGHWNNWFDTAYFTRNKGLRTLSYMLIEIIQRSQLSSMTGSGENWSFSGSSQSFTAETIRMATMVVVVLPIVCVYPFLQKYFVKGIMLGSVKG